MWGRRIVGWIFRCSVRLSFRHCRDSESHTVSLAALDTAAHLRDALVADAQLDLVGGVLGGAVAEPELALGAPAPGEDLPELVEREGVRRARGDADDVAGVDAVDGVRLIGDLDLRKPISWNLPFRSLCLWGPSTPARCTRPLAPRIGLSACLATPGPVDSLSCRTSRCRSDRGRFGIDAVPAASGGGCASGGGPTPSRVAVVLTDPCAFCLDHRHGVHSPAQGGRGQCEVLVQGLGESAGVFGRRRGQGRGRVAETHATTPRPALYECHHCT